MSKRVAISFSGGKDSILALDRAIKTGYKPVALLTTIDKYNNCSYFHNIDLELLESIADSLKIPLIPIITVGDRYEIDFQKTLSNLKKEGIVACIFGDIDIIEHRKWCENVCQKAEVEAIFPLWNEKREKLVYEFLKAGYNAIIKKVDLKYLSKKFLGMKLRENLLLEFERLGIDIAGENGEYHTIVVDGIIFKKKIKIEYGEIMEENGRAILEIKKERDGIKNFYTKKKS